jgi:hypothetical protein
MERARANFLSLHRFSSALVSPTAISVLQALEYLMRIEAASQNLYADLGVHDADAMQRKAALVSRIHELISSDPLAIANAANMIGVDISLLQCWLSGDFRGTDEAILLGGLQQLEIQSTASR